MFRRALTRVPGPDLFRGLTKARLGAPDVTLAKAQHAAYVAVLRGLGLDVTVLPALEGHPDACFVEDAALVAGGLAVITRPGAPSRRGETGSIDAALPADLPRAVIAAPGTLDGGDVLVAGDLCWIGLSERTNAEGAGQLVGLLGGRGLTCRFVPVPEGLHLKSSAAHLGGRRLLLTAALQGMEAFADMERLVVPEGEDYAANALEINGTVLLPAGYPRTAALLREAGLVLRELETSEFRKLDGGLTCLSIRY